MGQQRLANKVTSILHRIEHDLDSADSKIGDAMHVLDLDNDGLVGALCCCRCCHGRVGKLQCTGQRADS